MKASDNIENLLSALSENLSVEDIILADVLSDLATSISSKRVSMALSQQEFADYLGISQGLISRWENGDTNFTIKTLVQIAQKLDMTLQVSLKSSIMNNLDTKDTAPNNIIQFPNSNYHARSYSPSNWNFSAQKIFVVSKN